MRRKGSFGKKPKLTCQQSVRLTNREFLELDLLAWNTSHSISQLIRKFTQEGLAEHREELEKIKANPKYNIYLNNFLKDKSKSKSSRIHKLGSDLSSVPLEDERELAYLCFLESQVSEVKKI